MTRLEICIDNLESLFTAERSGADRIELCSALGLGGLTPSYGFMQLAARHASVPVYAMIRPRAGDFCFSAAEFELMLREFFLTGVPYFFFFVVENTGSLFGK